MNKFHEKTRFYFFAKLLFLFRSVSFFSDQLLVVQGMAPFLKNQSLPIECEELRIPVSPKGIKRSSVQLDSDQLLVQFSRLFLLQSGQ